MKASAAGWLVWSVFGAIVALTLINIVLVSSTPGTQTSPPDVPGMLSLLMYRLQPVVAAGLGALVAWRQARNPIGWLLIVLGVPLGVEGFARSYADFGLDLSHPLPGATWAAWVQSWLWATTYVGMFVLLLIFPTGRLVSPRWRGILGLCVIGPLAIAATVALLPGPIMDYPTLDNPVGVPGALSELVPLLQALILPVLLALLVASGASVVVRFWRARGVERQQLEWFAYATALMILGFAVSFSQWLGTWGDLISNICVTGVPAAIAVAVLRYRLYEIDLLINRTLVYGFLTLGLGATYWVSVALLQTVSRPLTAGSDLAVVASTLAVAALFQPLRRRIQLAVDRRFYRERYDAARTLESFSARLRDEIDLDALGGELLQVTRQTVQPQRVSLWLRPSGRRP